MTTMCDYRNLRLWLYIVSNGEVLRVTEVNEQLIRLITMKLSLNKTLRTNEP